MSFFEGAQNTTILGGTQIAAAPGSVVNYHEGNEQNLSTARGKLSAAAAHTAMHDSAARYDAPRCYRNTRAKYLDNLEHWMLGQDEEFDGKRLIWLHGGAGAGKSAIIQSIIERCTQHAVILGSFFFSRLDSSRNYAEVLIPTLAYQLARMFPSIMVVVETIITRHPLIFKASLRTQAYELLVQPILYLIQNAVIQSSDPIRRVFVIDGLDECCDHQKQALIVHVITSILINYDLPVSFLIASRPELAISDAFRREKNLQAILSTITLVHDGEAESDIRHFIQDSFLDIVDSHPWRKHITPLWPNSRSINRLVEKASGHFIYAAVVMKFIASSDEHPERALDVVEGIAPTRTESPFAQLDALYTYILTSARYSIQALGIIRHCILTSFNFSVAAVCCIQNISPEDVELFLSDIQSLVALSPNKTGELFITLKHQSLIDFLLDRSRSQALFVTDREYAATFVERYFHLLGEGPQGLTPSLYIQGWKEHCLISELAFALAHSQDVDLIQSLIHDYPPELIWNFCMESSTVDKTASSREVREMTARSLRTYIWGIRHSAANRDNCLYTGQVKQYIQLVFDDFSNFISRRPQHRIIPALIFSSDSRALLVANNLLNYFAPQFHVCTSYRHYFLALFSDNAIEIIDPRCMEAIRHVPESRISWSSELAIAMELVLQQLAHPTMLRLPKTLRPNLHRHWLLRVKPLKYLSLGSPKLSSPSNFKISALMRLGCGLGRARKIRTRREKCKVLLKAVIIYLHKSDCTGKAVKLARRLLPKAALWFPKLMKRVRVKMDTYGRRWQNSPEGLLEKAQSLCINDID